MQTRPIPTATEEVFSLLRRLRMDAIGGSSAFEPLRTALRRAKEDLVGVPHADAVIFAIASVADERWAWSSGTLEWEFFSSDVRVTKFYDLLGALLATSQNEPNNADAVWVFAKALAFGFRGMPPDGRTAASYMDSCRNFLVKSWGSFKELAPDAKIDGARTLAIRRRRGRLGVLLACAALFLVVASGLFGLEQIRQASIQWADETVEGR
jgi:type VI protein secretion system component VasF